MTRYLFCFGYERPDEWRGNRRNGTDFESSNGVWVDATSRESATAAGLAHADKFVGDLFRDAGVDDYPGWRACNYAHWIENKPLKRWSGLALESMPIIRAADDDGE